MSKKTNIPKEIAEHEDFQNLIDLLAVYSAADIGLKKLEAKSAEKYMEAVDTDRAEYTQLQEALTKSESALELIALKHPDWFQDERHIKTPYGTVKFHASEELVVANEEVSVVLIQNAIDKLERFRDTAMTNGKGDDIIAIDAQIEALRACLRTEVTLDLNALKKLDAAKLARFRIECHPKNNFSVKPVKVDLGKAVKESAQPKNPELKKAA